MSLFLIAEDNNFELFKWSEDYGSPPQFSPFIPITRKNR